MRAWIVHEAADPGRLSLETVPEPDPEAGLVVDVEAAGIGFPDLLMSRGEFQIRQPEPFRLGWEAAGTVVHAPTDSAFRRGDRVCSLSFGAFAEQVVANPTATFRLPDSLSFEEGAALPLNHLTALAALEFRGELTAGERLLVLGAAGGVGTAAVQMGKALGAHVVAAVSTDSKAAVAAAAGADEVIVGAAPGWGKALRRDAGGIDVVFDPVGGDAFDEASRALASRGRHVVVGFASGRIPSLGVNQLLLRNTDLRGCSWSVLTERPGGLPHAMDALARMVEAGTVRPAIGARVGFDDLPDGLRTLEKREATGKLVLAAAA